MGKSARIGPARGSDLTRAAARAARAYPGIIIIIVSLQPNYDLLCLKPVIYSPWIKARRADGLAALLNLLGVQMSYNVFTPMETR
eukprot:SAG31_NODE_427_length_15813_cov_13.679649_4_plen_85_part_00